MFLACTPYQGGHYNTGRQTFLLPVTWENDWPVILPPGEAVPYVHAGPAGAGFAAPTARVEAPAFPLTGNFTWHDDFDRAELGNPWLFLRAPQETWWSLDNGSLRLTPRADKLRERHNPTFVGRRLQHNRFTVQTRLQLPSATGVSAGLSAFHNETRHYNFGVRRVSDSGDAYELYVEAQRGPVEAAQFTTGRFAAAPGSPLALRLTGHDTDYVFEYSTDGGTNWTQLGGTFDARNLSVETSYDFIGVLLGLYATSAE